MVIRSKKDIERLIDKWGFLPFFVNDIEGFSIEEHVDPKCWFTAIPGPWEWKGEIIRDGYAYGKIFGKGSAERLRVRRPQAQSGLCNTESTQRTAVKDEACIKRYRLFCCCITQIDTL